MNGSKGYADLFKNVGPKIRSGCRDFLRGSPRSTVPYVIEQGVKYHIGRDGIKYQFLSRKLSDRSF